MRSFRRPIFIGAFFFVVGALYGCQPMVRDFATTDTGGLGGAGGAGISAVTAGPSSSVVSATGAGGLGDGGGGGGPPQAATGDCELMSDCPDGEDCVEVTPGGWRVCTQQVQLATGCIADMFDECCVTKNCTEGLCMAAPLQPYCSGPVPIKHNVCAVNKCATDSDCSAQGDAICAIAGTLDRKVRSCVPAACHTNKDCTEEPLGICAPVSGACCSKDGIAGLYCVYPSDGCRKSSDCKAGSYCDTSAPRARCVEGEPICAK